MSILALLMSACSLFATQPPPTLAVVNTPTSQDTATPIPPTETATATPLPTETPQILDYGPDNFPANVNPLTGLLVSDPTLLERRPSSIKVQLFPRNDRPPFGLSSADVVYDYYQNNGLTRLNAIFYGTNAEQVGPIRSARLLDNDIIRMYKAIFAFAGADKRILNKLFNSNYSDRLVVEGPSNCPPMCRNNIGGNNYLMVNTTQMNSFVANKGVSIGGQNLDGMLFQYDVPANGTPVSQMYFRHSISAYARWDYDPATGTYLRFQDDAEAMDAQAEVYVPLVDRLTGDQIRTQNVVVLIVKHGFVFKSGNSEIVEIEFTGNGDAYAFRDGQVYKILWTRPDADSLLRLTYPDGSLFPLKQGTTWFQPVGKTSIMTQPQEGAWRFENRFP